MRFNADRVRFKGKAISAAIRQRASIEDEQASQFFEQLYSEWQSTGLSLNEADLWLDRRLAGEFCSLADPPQWVESEPAWPFLDGKPMVFLTQCSMGDEEISRLKLSPSETVYLFGGRKSVGSGAEMVYRTISQFTE